DSTDGTDLHRFFGYAGQTFQVFTGAAPETAPALPPSMAVVKPGRSTSACLSRFKWEADFFDCAVLLISDYPFNPCRLLLASVFYLVIFNNP
ncbi:MAG: hypothetical protein Q7U38_15480, partial [Methylobacter sp.]|nr:hypothetical protein [Methylobacter sp.]